MKKLLFLNDASILPGTAKAVVLTSASAKDENTLEEPLKVSPREEDVRFNGSRFTRSFPGNSFTILRVHTSEQSAQR
ncbi:MAG TPA: hypothetical protein VIV82_07125 [Verrucomicrobiae bacterium]|jgi:hypothetical protein